MCVMLLLNVVIPLLLVFFGLNCIVMGWCLNVTTSPKFKGIWISFEVENVTCGPNIDINDIVPYY